MGLQVILPTETNPSVKPGVSLRYQGVLPVRGGQFLIHSLNLFHLHNQNDTVSGAQEWERTRGSFLMARIARTSMTPFIRL